MSHAPDPEERIHPSQGLVAATDRFLAVVQGTADLFWLLTPDGSMQEISPSWQAFTGQQDSSWQGPGWLDAVYRADQPQLETMLHHFVLSSQPAESECRIRRSDGVYRLIRLRAFPVYTPHGTIRELVVCGTDITSEQMSEAQIHLAVKASGVGMWHHDLVTQQFVATDQCKRLLGIAGDAPMTYESFLALVHPDDRPCIYKLRARALAEKKDYGVEYRVIWPDGSLHWLTSRARYLFDIDNQPSDLIGAAIDITELKQTVVNVLADRNRIRQVITNYITNAIRYTSPDQPIHIGLTAQQDLVRVWVRDTGPGLSQEAQKDIWLRYHQVKGAPVQSGSGKGLGLGLYICKTLIEQHNGACGVESSPGEGATFWFTLPIVT